MPALGADMEVGTVLEWRVAVGDTVHRGDIVAVVDTEKSDIDVEVFEDGVVAEILVEEGVEVPVGTVLARISSPVAPPAPPAASSARQPQRESPAGVPTLPRDPSPPTPMDAPGVVRASPLARRLATGRGVELASIAGSGPGGAVVAADVDAGRTAVAEAAEVAASTTPAASSTEAPPRRRHDAGTTRRATAELMARSKHEIPHYYLATTVDLGPAMNWLADVNADRPVTERLLPAALLLKAVARAAREVPALNGHYDEEAVPAESVDLGIAISLRGGGLVAPVIRDADRLTLDALMMSLRDLVGRARAGRLRGSDVTAASLTVTNLGDQGVEEVFGVIYPPQVALVGFGTVVERPWATGGLLGVRPVVRATLSADHRASDGHEGARFLATVDRQLRHPEAL